MAIFEESNLSGIYQDSFLEKLNALFPDKRFLNVSYHYGGLTELDTFDLEGVLLPDYPRYRSLIPSKQSPRIQINRVIYNDPYTIVLWSDDTKTIVKCQEGDTYNPNHGLALCLAKKLYGNTNKFNDVIKDHLVDDLCDDKLERLKNAHEVQGIRGNWNYDEYMFGLYNGLELALSILEDREPKYKKAPKQWGKDKQRKIENELYH